MLPLLGKLPMIWRREKAGHVLSAMAKRASLIVLQGRRGEGDWNLSHARGRVCYLLSDLA